MTALSKNAEELLELVRARYIDSRDFNGFYISGRSVDPEQIAAAIELLDADLVQVVGQSDYMNIHIRPWPSWRSATDQREELEQLNPDMYGVCLYPTSKGMKGVRLPKKFKNSPYSIAMAKGRSTLELAYFSTDVLEPYRNDARYLFSIDDFGVNMGIGDDAYLDETEPEKDKVTLWHIGFAYDLSKYVSGDPDSPIIRRVAAFYGDLDDLSPEHQQRWASYQVEDQNLSPHPVWFASQMGNWPDGIGPFQRLFQELQYINVLFERVWNISLFKDSNKPKELGWILRPDQREWDDFISQLDKVLSENIQTGALDTAGVPKKNSHGDSIGTLARLHLFMTMNKVDDEKATWALKPLRDVRTARMKPAHTLRTNITNKTFVRKQVKLLHDVNEVLINIRQWLASHPKNKDWKENWPDLRDYPF